MAASGGACAASAATRRATRRVGARAMIRRMDPTERDRLAAMLDLQEGRVRVPLLEDGEIRELLRTARRIAVIGASDRPGRPSGEVFAALLRAGYDAVPVTPRFETVHGRRAYPDLAAAVAADGPVRDRGCVPPCRGLPGPCARSGRSGRPGPVAPARDRELGGRRHRARPVAWMSSWTAASPWSAAGSCAEGSPAWCLHKARSCTTDCCRGRAPARDATGPRSPRRPAPRRPPPPRAPRGRGRAARTS